MGCSNTAHVPQKEERSMSFVTDFNSILGTSTDAFKNIWTAINSPTKVSIGTSPAQNQNPVNGNTGVQGALQNAASKMDAGTLTRNILLGVAALVLALGLLVVRKK